MSKVENHLKDKGLISPFGERLVVEYEGFQYTVTSLDEAGIYDTKRFTFNQKVIVYNHFYAKFLEYNGKFNKFIKKETEFQSWIKEIVTEILDHAPLEIKAEKFVTPQPVDTEALNQKIKNIDGGASIQIKEKKLPQKGPTIVCGKDAIKELLENNLGKFAQLFTAKDETDETVQNCLKEGVVITFASGDELKAMAGTDQHEGFVAQEFDHIIARSDEIAKEQFNKNTGEIHKLKAAGLFKRLLGMKSPDEISMTKGILQSKIPWDDVQVYDANNRLETIMHYKEVNEIGAGKSSNHRFSPIYPHGMRVVEGPDSEGNMVPHAFAGRAETIDKAKEVIEFIVKQLLASNRENFIAKCIEDNGKYFYHLSLAIQSFCKTEIPDDGEYAKFTQAEREAYNRLVREGTPITVELKGIDETPYTLNVVLDEAFISNTTINGACYLQDRLLPEWWSHRKERALEGAKESDGRLFTRIESLNKKADSVYIKTKEHLDTRRHLLQPWEELLLREHLYILAEIPSIGHCKSSKDRTGIALAIKTALRQWIAEKKSIDNDDILTLVNNEDFKELVLRKLLPGIASSQYNTMTAGLKLASPLRDPSLMMLLPDRCKKLYVFNTIFYGFILGLIALPLVASLGLLTTLYRYGEEQWKKPESGWTLSSPVWEEYWMMFKDLWRMYDLWSHGLTPEAEKLVFGKLSMIDSKLHWLHKRSLEMVQKLGGTLSKENSELLGEEEEELEVED